MSVQGARITPRDVEWLAWSARWRFVTGPAIAREWTRRGEPVWPQAVDRRLRAFVQLGLVEFERVLADTPRLFWLTRQGMQMAGIEGALVGPKFADIRHDAIVLDVAHWLASERVPSHELITEREIRRSETPNQYEEVEAHYSIPLSDGGRNRRAYPDLVSVNAQGRAWGHEVEWSRKEHRRLVRLMLGYGASEVYGGAVYYASAAVLAGVERAAEEANRITQERHGRSPIHVQGWPIAATEEGRGHE